MFRKRSKTLLTPQSVCSVAEAGKIFMRKPCGIPQQRPAWRPRLALVRLTRETTRQPSTRPWVLPCSMLHAERFLRGTRCEACWRGVTQSGAVRVVPMLHARCPVAPASEWRSPRGPWRMSSCAHRARRPAWAGVVGAVHSRMCRPVLSSQPRPRRPGWQASRAVADREHMACAWVAQSSSGLVRPGRTRMRWEVHVMEETPAAGAPERVREPGVEDGCDHRIPGPPGDRAFEVLRQRASHRAPVDPGGGRTGLRVPRASGLLETRSAPRQGALAPLAAREGGTPQRVADAHGGWLVHRGRPYDDAGSPGQGWRRRLGSDQRVQILRSVWRYKNAGSNRRWQRGPPCHTAVSTYRSIAPYRLK